MRTEKHGRGIGPAREALHTFASVGVERFDVTQTDVDGNQRGFRRAQTVEMLDRDLETLMDSAIQHQRNLIVRPHSSKVTLVQLDDLAAITLERIKEFAFLTLTTSPASHQAWVAVRECGAEFARRLRRGSGADPGASGATRLAGSINYKRKYAPEFPQVSILDATPNRIATLSELEATGLVAHPEVQRVPPGRVPPTRQEKRWPSYERCLQGAPAALGSNRPDVSRADFTFCMIAIDWGWSLAETCARLLQKSSKARSHGEEYAKVTVQRAAATVHRRHFMDELE